MKKAMVEIDQNIDLLVNKINAFNDDASVKSIIVLSSAKIAHPKSVLDPCLKNLKKGIVGGIFPEVVFEGKRYDDKAIVVGLNFDMETLVISDLDEKSDDQIESPIEALAVNSGSEDNAIFLFMDCLCRNKQCVFDSMFNLMGASASYIGAGAGSLTFEKFPCLFSNEGMQENAVVFGLGKTNLSVGVAHGWESISKAFKVTESDNNQMKTLDWKPAMEVYQEVIEGHARQSVDFGDFLNCVKSYPFGISKMDDEMIVRDPFKTENNNVFALDNVEEGSFVKILYGDIDLLLEGASKARNNAINSAGGPRDNTEVMIIDCISRVLFMGDSFDKELAILDPEKKAFGALTLGEIANNGDSYLEVFNKTAVVGAING